MKTVPKVVRQFGLRVAKIRNERAISQEKLGSLAGVHRTYIGMIERGEKNITIANMEKIARALGLRLKDLVIFRTHFQDW